MKSGTEITPEQALNRLASGKLVKAKSKIKDGNDLVYRQSEFGNGFSDSYEYWSYALRTWKPSMTTIRGMERSKFTVIKKRDLNV